MSKILVNTRFLIKNKLEGMGRFSYEILSRMVKEHPEHQFYFMFDRKWDDSFIFADNVTPIKVSPQARHPILWYWWFEQSIPHVIRKIQPDVFLSLDGFTTLKTKTKRVTVFHDIAFEHYPNDVGWLVRNYYKTFVPAYAKVSDKLVAVSAYSKQDLVNTYAVSPDKIDVVYNAAGELFKPLTAEQQEVVRNDFCDGNSYFCFVGALQPRKNIVNMFNAFDAFKAATNSNVKMLVVGRKAWQSDEIVKTYEQMSFKNDVIFTGHISHKALSHVYGAALALIYVPYFEGFGIPIVEAQQSGCAVITSNVTSMPEVAGEGALFVNPFDIEDIAKGMLAVANDDNLRNNLIEKGFENCQRFSWVQSAKALWQTISNVL